VARLGGLLDAAQTSNVKDAKIKTQTTAPRPQRALGAMALLRPASTHRVLSA
jgi:hypothetical protein